MTTGSQLGLCTKIIPQLIFMLCDQICSVSNNLNNQYCNILNYGIKNKTLYLGTDFFKTLKNKYYLREELNLNPKKSYIINVSLHDTRKQIDKVIDTLAVIVKFNSDVHLLQIGGDEIYHGFTQKLKDYARDKNVEKHITWIGKVNNVADYLTASDIMLHLPKSEALGLVIAEAMVYECAVVAMDVGGIPELVNHSETGFLVGLDTTIDDSVVYIQDILTDIDLQKRLIKNAKSNVYERFNNDIQVIKYLEEYQPKLKLSC